MPGPKPWRKNSEGGIHIIILNRIKKGFNRNNFIVINIHKLSGLANIVMKLISEEYPNIFSINT